LSTKLTVSKQSEVLQVNDLQHFSFFPHTPNFPTFLFDLWLRQPSSCQRSGETFFCYFPLFELADSFQRFEHFVDAFFLLFHIRMHIEVEGRADIRMTKNDANGLVVTLAFNASCGK